MTPPTEIVEVSPTQVETHQGCQRKWAFYKVDGIKAPPSPSAELGTETHKHLERYAKTGVSPTGDSHSSLLALHTIEHWPNPNVQTVHAESDFTFSVPVDGLEQVRFNGRQDMNWTDASGLWWVGDLKTTSDLKYAKNASVLRKDPQALCYAMNYVLQGHERVGLKWVYTRTRGAYKVLPVETILTAEETITGFEQVIVPTARLIAKAKTTPGIRALDFPATPSECSKYGGCYYQKSGHCKLSAMEQLKGLGEQMDFLSKINAAKAAQKTLAEESAKVPTPALEPEETKATEVAINPPVAGSSLLEKLKAKAAQAQPAPVASPTPAKAVECACGEPALPGKRECADCAAPAPVGNKNPILPSALHHTTVAQTAEKAQPSVQRAPAKDITSAASPERKQATITVEVNPNMREGTVVDPNTLLATKPEPGNEPVLCVGCIPDGTHANLSDFLREAHRAFCAGANVLDYRLVDYGKGQGGLVALAKEMASQRVWSGYWYADPNDAMTALVLSEIVPYFDTVIRAVR